MKENTKNLIFVAIATIIIFGINILFVDCCHAQTTKDSKWIEKATIEVPYDVEIIKGTTKNGNPKYIIDIEDINIYVSPSNYEKFMKKEIVLLIVEWYNPETGKYRYTTRQKSKSNLVKKLNLDELW